MHAKRDMLTIGLQEALCFSNPTTSCDFHIPLKRKMISKSSCQKPTQVEQVFFVHSKFDATFLQSVTRSACCWASCTWIVAFWSRGRRTWPRRHSGPASDALATGNKWTFMISVVFISTWRQPRLFLPLERTAGGTMHNTQSNRVAQSVYMRHAFAQWKVKERQT
jgi:hypothetical protein